MHYLDQLAERLVLAYEDEENLREWATFADRAGKRSALVRALRQTLEREVSARYLSYQDSNLFSEYVEPGRLFPDNLQPFL